MPKGTEEFSIRHRVKRRLAAIIDPNLSRFIDRDADRAVQGQKIDRATQIHSDILWAQFPKPHQDLSVERGVDRLADANNHGHLPPHPVEAGVRIDESEEGILSHLRKWEAGLVCSISPALFSGDFGRLEIVDIARDMRKRLGQIVWIGAGGRIAAWLYLRDRAGDDGIEGPRAFRQGGIVLGFVAGRFGEEDIPSDNGGSDLPKKLEEISMNRTFPRPASQRGKGIIVDCHQQQSGVCGRVMLLTEVKAEVDRFVFDALKECKLLKANK